MTRDAAGTIHASCPTRRCRSNPATAVLHYAQAVFDGLKAFRGRDGVIRLFRPDRHAQRLGSSSERLCIPAVPVAQVIESFHALIDVDQAWVPSKLGTSLYIRPTIIASEAFLGVRPAKSYLYYVILSPVGAYYAEGMNPVKILIADKYVRAVEGGLGAAKTAGNYAASLYASEEAKKAGYTQVLWLDGVQRRYIDEVGTMNIMVKIGGEVITPAAHLRHHPARRDARFGADLAQGLGREDRRAPDRDRRGDRGATPPARSRKYSAPAPPPWSRRSASSATRATKY